MESYFIREHKTFGKDVGYNITKGGDGFFGIIPSNITKKKLSNSLRGRKLSEETKRKMSLANKGRIFTEEHKQKLKGRIFTEEHKRKIREARKHQSSWIKGKSHSEETKGKISKSRTGVPHPHNRKLTISGNTLD